MKITTKNFEKHFQELMIKLPMWNETEYDVTQLEEMPAIVTFLEFENKFLLLKRSKKVGSGSSLWSTVTGYYDEPKSVKEIFAKELMEELGLGINIVKELKKSKISVVKTEGKTFVGYLLLAKLKEKITPKLDSEHTEFGWFTIEEIERLNTYPKLKENLQSFF